jgi:hypothetical protein
MAGLKPFTGIWKCWIPPRFSMFYGISEDSSKEIHGSVQQPVIICNTGEPDMKAGAGDAAGQ